MASYTISTAVTNAVTGQLINTGDTVTVTSSGSLYGVSSYGIYGGTSAGAHGGFETLNISGTVRGGAYGFYDDGTSGSDTITISSTGHVYGSANPGIYNFGIYVDGGSNTLTNDGTIVTNGANGAGVDFAAGGNTITNSGSIISSNAAGSSAIYIYGGFNTITNSGKLSTVDSYDVDLIGTGTDEGHNTITNSGTMAGYWGILAFYGSNTVTNTGTISTSYTGIDVTGDHNSVTNSGTVSSILYLDGSSNRFVNTGSIAGEYGVHGNGANNVIQNAATGGISGTHNGIFFDTGKSAVITNAGTVTGGYGMNLEYVTNGHIKIVGGGSVIGDDYGIYTYNTSGDVSNIHIIDNGMIQGGAGGLYFEYGTNHVVKVGAHGTITGGDSGIYDDDGKSDHIFNDGTITGGDYAIYVANHGYNHIHNAGIVTGNDAAIAIQDGDNRITNKGTISGSTYGAIYAYHGDNVVTNLSGGVLKFMAHTDGYATLFFNEGSNAVTNSGKILLAFNGYTSNDAFFARSGHNTVINNAGGLISDFHANNTVGYAIQMYDGSNSVTNDGKIVGTVGIGTTGTNSYDGSDGRLKGTVIGGSGSDTILLGKGHGAVIGGGGADSISIGSGAQDVVYTAATDSDITASDAVDGFKPGTDTFTFNLGGHAFTGLSAVTVNSLSGVTDSAINAAVAGHFDPYGAVALSVSSGLYAGDVFLVVDANGDSKFDAAPNDDYLVVLTHLSGTLSSSDIITT